jgi:hypothetical protein
MTAMADLRSALLDLLHQIEETDIKLIIGGGYGIYLKSEYVRRTGARTLLRNWPEPRSTNDLDLFLRPELLIQSTRLKPLAEAMKNLGYDAVPGAENYQFVKEGSRSTNAGTIKIDFLSGPLGCFKGTSVKADNRRARPNPSVGIHAHPVDEAPTLEEGLLTLSLEGCRSTGEICHADISLPHPFTFIMMKLFAFRDRFSDSNKEFGRYHALDIYTILSTMVEDEWNQGLMMRDNYADHPFVRQAGQLVSEYFSILSGRGIIRMMESPYYRSEFQLEEFMAGMKELFP